MESILNKSCVIASMRTAFCPLCGAGMSVVLRDQAKKEWKECPSCGEISYIELTQEKSQIVALQKILDDVLEKPAGGNLFSHLLKHDKSTMHELLFNSSKSQEPNIMYMAEVGLLAADSDTYALHPNLKSFVAKKFK